MSAVEIVFVADDFGWTDAINAAIVHAHTHGALQGASLMMGQAATAEAVALAQQHPALQVGWHLHLSHSQPLTRAAWPWGDSHSKAGWLVGCSPQGRQLVREEIREQWAAFQGTGLQCAFVNVHHHLHAHPFVWRILRETLPVDYAGWIRLGLPRWFGGRPTAGWLRHWTAWRRARCGWRTSATLWGADRLYRMRAAEVRTTMAGLEPGLHEFMFHPRALTDDADLQALVELGS